MNFKSRDEQIDFLVETLECSIAEAEDIIESDKVIDKGGRNDWEPSVEEEKAMRKANKIVGERKKPTTPVKRERKQDVQKEELVSLLANALKEAGFEPEIVNAARLVAFSAGNANFEVTLVRKNAKK